MSEQPEKPTGFNAYATDYAELIRDPIREKFAASNRFFFERKLQIIRSFYQQTRCCDTKARLARCRLRTRRFAAAWACAFQIGGRLRSVGRHARVML